MFKDMCKWDLLQLRGWELNWIGDGELQTGSRFIFLLALLTGFQNVDVQAEAAVKHLWCNGHLTIL